MDTGLGQSVVFLQTLRHPGHLVRGRCPARKFTKMVFEVKRDVKEEAKVKRDVKEEDLCIEEPPIKRLKVEEDDNNHAGAAPDPPAALAAPDPPGCSGTPPQEDLAFDLLALPENVLDLILRLLDSKSLDNISSCCWLFWARDKVTRLRLTHQYARAKVVRLVGEARATRWK